MERELAAGRGRDWGRSRRTSHLLIHWDYTPAVRAPPVLHDITIHPFHLAPQVILTMGQAVLPASAAAPLASSIADPVAKAQFQEAENLVELIRRRTGKDIPSVSLATPSPAVVSVQL